MIPIGNRRLPFTNTYCTETDSAYRLYANELNFEFSSYYDIPLVTAVTEHTVEDRRHNGIVNPRLDSRDLHMHGGVIWMGQLAVTSPCLTS